MIAVKIKDIKGALMKKHKHSWIENFDIGGKFCTICGISQDFDKNSGHYQNGYLEGFDKAITQQGEIAIGMNREKLLKILYTVPYCESETIADAIIQALPTLLEVVK